MVLVPLVHQTGGLADTVIDYSEKNLKNNSATGFVINEYSSEKLFRTNNGCPCFI